jgi:hypothetical protein
MSPDISQIFDINIPYFYQIATVLKIIFIFVSALFLGFMIFALVKTTWLKRLILWDLQEFLTYNPYGARKLYKQWQEIKKRLDGGMESEYKLAVIEADSVLNDVLEKMGFGGATLGERLNRVAPETLPTLSEVVEAHKIRNNIVHDPDYQFSQEEAEKTMGVYEKALSDLQAF